ncbi:MAG: aminotransferase class V-fold PLP-dependent enzyme [Nitrospirae bacterium]|nr:aminotransferase class V-fold PLP-dependent enzyme [Nitrospirota bacterium]
MRRVPVTAVPIRWGDIRRAWRTSGPHRADALRTVVAAETRQRHAFLAGSGSTALWMLLRALRQFKPDRTEVVLPAYGVPSLHLVVKKAGLTSRLCDIDPETLGFQMGDLDRVVGESTLAVIAVHLFGIPQPLEEVAARARRVGAVLIEDVAQALGGRLGDRPVPHVGEAGFVSFDRGKNVSAYGGGAAVTSDERLSEMLRSEEAALHSMPTARHGLWPLVLPLYMLAMRPRWYGAFFPLVHRYKLVAPHADLVFSRLRPLQASLLLELWPRFEPINYRRGLTGRYLNDWLRRLPGLRLPRVPEGAYPVFNRLPVIFESSAVLARVQSNLFARGIDSAVMYPKAVHQVYPEAGEGRSLPHAEGVAPLVLTLPTHPYLRPQDLETILDVFETCLGR